MYDPQIATKLSAPQCITRPVFDGSLKRSIQKGYKILVSIFYFTAGQIFSIKSRVLKRNSSGDFSIQSHFALFIVSIYFVGYQTLNVYLSF